MSDAVKAALTQSLEMLRYYREDCKTHGFKSTIDDILEVESTVLSALKQLVDDEAKLTISIVGDDNAILPYSHIEKRIFEMALRHTQYKPLVAKQLQLSKSTVYRMITKYKLTGDSHDQTTKESAREE